MPTSASGSLKFLIPGKRKKNRSRLTAPRNHLLTRIPGESVRQYSPLKPGTRLVRLGRAQLHQHRRRASAKIEIAAVDRGKLVAANGPLVGGDCGDGCCRVHGCQVGGAYGVGAILKRHCSRGRLSGG